MIIVPIQLKRGERERIREGTAGKERDGGEAAKEDSRGAATSQKGIGL